MKLLALLKDFVYPPICLHCADKGFPLCSSCQYFLSPLDSKERCPICFASCCTKECYRRPTIIKKKAAVWEYRGPPASIVKQLKYGQQIYLAKGGAAFLALQLLQMQWKLPELIIPIPQSLPSYLARGYNQSELLARQLGKILQRPCRNILRRPVDTYPQTQLTKKQREKHAGTTILLKRKPSLEGKTVLLIDDVMTTGKTLEEAAMALMPLNPQNIYALTLCHSDLYQSA